MAEIKLGGIGHHTGGPAFVRVIGLNLNQNAQGEPCLWIFCGDDTLILSPADRSELRRFADKLMALCNDSKQWPD